MKRLVVTAAHAFLPGVDLSLAHVAGTYLPADVYARLAPLATGAPARFVTGIDVRGRLAERELRRWRSAEDMNDFYAMRFANGLAQLGIEPTEFVRTDDPRLGPLVDRSLERLRDRGLVTAQPSVGYHCRSCGEHLAKSEVTARLPGRSEAIDAKSFGGDLPPAGALLRCSCCAGEDVAARPGTAWVMDLPRDRAHRHLLETQPYRSARKAFAGTLAGDFTSWELSREAYYGRPLPFDADRALYIWYESLAAKVLGIHEDELPATRFASFFGKNVLQYYALVFPLLLRAGFGVDSPDLLLAARGFCDLARSDATLLDPMAALASYPRDAVRFYCAITAPDDVVDFALTRERLEATLSGVLRKTFGRYLRAARDLLARSRRSPAELFGGPPPPERQRFAELHREGAVRKILLELEAFARREIPRVEQGRPEEIARDVTGGFALVHDVLACVVPDMIQAFRIFDVDEHGFVVPSALRPPPPGILGWERTARLTERRRAA